jgi:glutaredoxin
MLTLACSLLVLGVGSAQATLEDFARCLTKAGARFYGTSWCPHCAAQRRTFGTAFNQISYVECAVDGTKETTEECKQADVTTYPTWEFRDGSRETGQMSLEQLASETGCKYERGPEPQIIDVPGNSGILKLPGAEGVEILELP